MEVPRDLNKFINTVSLAGHALRVLRLDRLSADPLRVRGYQEHALRRLVAHAYERVPFYRRWFDDAGVRPEHVRSLDDLARLPILTKSALRTVPSDDLLDAQTRREDCYLTETSGSTGQPTRIYKDRNAIFSVAAWASPIIISRWFARRARSIMTLLQRDEGTIEAALVRALPRFLLRIAEGDALADPARQLEQINAFRPEVLISYPSALRNLAIYARDRGLTVHQPAAVVWTAEVLDSPTHRLVRQVFQSEFFAIYGSTEAGLIALECGHHRGAHVIATQTIVELLRDGRPVPPGEPGDVVVTDLTNFASPIIRYAGLGDVARWSAARCPCGRTLPMLEVIEGRRVDSFVLPGGRVVHPYTLTWVMKDIAGVRQYQLIQETPDRVRVLLARLDTDGQGAPEAIATALRHILGPAVSIEVNAVSEIPLAPGERTPRVVRSLVPH